VLLVDALLTAHPVAETLAVSSKWVYAAAQRGDLPCVHVGRSVRFIPAEIVAWIESGGRPSVPGISR